MPATPHISPVSPRIMAAVKLESSPAPHPAATVILHTPFRPAEVPSQPRLGVSARASDRRRRTSTFTGRHCLLCVMNGFVERPVKIAGGDKCNVPARSRRGTKKNQPAVPVVAGRRASSCLLLPFFVTVFSSRPVEPRRMSTVFS